MGFVSKLISVCVQTIYPRKCVMCQAVMSIDRNNAKMGLQGEVCKKCKGKIKYISSLTCLKCGREIDREEDEYCTDCRKKYHIFDKGISLFKYDDMLKESIYRFKYQGMKIYGSYYAKELAGRFANEISSWNADAVIAVPIHKSRLRKRGYNQAQIIAKELVKNINSGIEKKLIIDDNLLVRTKKTVPQKELDVWQRKKNIENAFKVSENVVEYKKVILVDDIYTTGCTIDECARVLKEAGVLEVYFVTLCIGQGI